MAWYESKQTTDVDRGQGTGWVASYTGRQALRCKTVVKEGAEAPEVMTAGTSTSTSSRSRINIKLLVPSIERSSLILSGVSTAARPNGERPQDHT